jgi:hypothetical protein
VPFVSQLCLGPLRYRQGVIPHGLITEPGIHRKGVLEGLHSEAIGDKDAPLVSMKRSSGAVRWGKSSVKGLSVAVARGAHRQ